MKTLNELAWMQEDEEEDGGLIFYRGRKLLSISEGRYVQYEVL